MLGAILVATVAAVSALAQAQGAGPTVYTVVGVAAGDTLNLRASPTHRSAALGGIPPGAADVVGTGRFADVGGQRWAEVVYRGVTGWVNASYLRAAAPLAGSAAFAVVGVAAVDTLNMRAGPGVGNAVVGRIPPNARGIVQIGADVSVGATVWRQVAYGGSVGWVNSQFLQREALASEPKRPAAPPMTLPVEAESAGSEGPRIALVIGNGAYQAPVSPLPNPPNDGREIAKALREVGFKVIELIDGDLASMRSSLAAFSAQAKNAEMALVFYAGHGLQVNGENYLLPVSATLRQHEDVLGQSMSLSDIMDALRSASAALSVVILDACRNNPLIDQLASSARSRAVSVDIRPGLARRKGLPRMLIAFSTDPDNVALDGTGSNSPFTAALLKATRRPEVEIRLMFGEVRGEVIKATAGAQTPWVEESVVGQFFFRPPPKIRKERFFGAWDHEHYTLRIDGGEVKLSKPPYAGEAPRSLAAGSGECGDHFKQDYAVIPIEEIPNVLTDPQVYAWAKGNSQGKSLLVMSMECGFGSHRFYLLLTEFQSLLFVEFSEQDFLMREEFYRTPR